MWCTFRNIHIESEKMQRKINKQTNKQNKITVRVNNKHCHNNNLYYITNYSYVFFVLFFAVQGPYQGKVIFFIVFLLRESRCKVQTVPLSPSYTGYKCPLVCPLEPALREREKDLTLIHSYALYWATSLSFCATRSKKPLWQFHNDRFLT